MSGFYSVPLVDFPRAPGGHQALPVPGSYLSEQTGQPAVLTESTAYPVTAECKVCHRPIRLGKLEQMEWLHVPAGDTP